MSRVGKRPVKIPVGVKVQCQDRTVEVTGKGATLKRTTPLTIKVEVKDSEVFVHNLSDDPEKRALHGLTRTVVANMIQGVVAGYAKELELQGVGYRAQVQGNKLTMQLGFSHPVEFILPPGIAATVEANTKITLKGADKELLGLTAANLRRVRPPEPYKGKGIRYLGEVVTLKQGKTAGAAAGGTK